MPLQLFTLELAHARNTNPDLIRREQAPYREAARIVEGGVTMRALHIVNEPSGPGGLFLAPLRLHGFTIDSVDVAQHELPENLAGYDAVISCGGTANTHESDVYPWIDQEIDLLREALRDGVPVIGLCLGAQLLTKAAGGDGPPQRPLRGRLGGGAPNAAAAPIRCSAACPRRSWRCSGTTTRASSRQARSSWPATRPACRRSAWASRRGARSSTSRSRATSC